MTAPAPQPATAQNNSRDACERILNSLDQYVASPTLLSGFTGGVLPPACVREVEKACNTIRVVIRDFDWLKQTGAAPVRQCQVADQLCRANILRMQRTRPSVKVDSRATARRAADARTTSNQ
jgi:hypothetical protein